MFSFHKPKIYRSISGCCICRAKSSSSRFTDSKKYEPAFPKCFRIAEKRSGEICNACVLLVKRFKKLPTDTKKDWHHVVDARAGPGTKSFKTSKGSSTGSNVSDDGKKLRYKSNKHLHLNKRTSNAAVSGATSSTSGESGSDDDLEEEEDVEDDEMMMMMDDDHPPLMATMMDENDDCCEMDGTHGSASTTASQRRLLRRSSRLAGSKALDGYGGHRRRHRKAYSPSQTSSLKVMTKNRPKSLRDQFVPFIDDSIWKEEKICCGIIFKGPNNEVLIYPELFQPCRSSSASRSSESSMENTIFGHESTSIKTGTTAGGDSRPTPVLIKKKSQEFSSGRSTPVDDTPPALLKPHLEISDDHSSNGGVICDENSMQDSNSDRLSTVSSSLLDNDDGNISSSSETFDSLHHHHHHNHHHGHHTSHAHDLVKNQKSNTTPTVPSLAVV